MKRKSSTKTNNSVFVCCALIVIVLLQLFVKADVSIEMNTDEGINLIKAYLYSKGIPLYKEIWSDQPPLFTLILSSLSLFDMLTFEMAKRIVIFCSAILIVSLAYLCRLERRGIAPVLAAAFLLLTTDYLIISRGVLIGLPSLAIMLLAFAAAANITRAKSPKLLCLTCGILAGCALCTKLFVILALPALLVSILRVSSHHSLNLTESLQRVFVFAIGLFIAVAGIDLIAGPSIWNEEWRQLFKSHIAASKVLKYMGYPVFSVSLMKDWCFALIALIGAVVVVIRKDIALAIPITWLVFSVTALSLHAPVWAHQYLIISIPLAWSAALTLGTLIDEAINEKRPVLIVLSIAIIFCCAICLPRKFQQLRRDSNMRYNLMNLKLIEELKTLPDNYLVFTDRPIYPFLASKMIPPNLAVFSQKRLRTNINFKNEIRNTFISSKPDVVIIGRFYELEGILNPMLGQQYQRKDLGGKVKVFYKKTG